MRTIRTIVSNTALLTMLMMSMAAATFALDLQTARSSGLAGEVDNGLLAIPPGAASEAQPLIETINNSRRVEYANVAAKNNLTIEVVGGMMFQKIYTRLPAGTWVQIEGKWAKKAK